MNPSLLEAKLSESRVAVESIIHSLEGYETAINSFSEVTDVAKYICYEIQVDKYYPPLEELKFMDANVSNDSWTDENEQKGIH